MWCHVRTGVLDDLDVFVVSVYRACGGPWRILYFRIEHIMARPNHHKSCPNDENWQSCTRWRVRASDMYVTVMYSVRQIISVVIVKTWVLCIYILIEHIKARPNHHKSCPDDKSWVSPMWCHVRTGVLDDFDFFVVSVYRACGGPWRILYFRIEHIMARPNHHKSCPIDENWQSCTRWRVRPSDMYVTVINSVRQIISVVIV